MPDFSVLLPVYHKEKPDYLERCLRSLAAQTRPAKEIVIVKDGRLPAALEDVLKNWRERLPLKITGYDENKGLAYALNYGLKHCSNEIVARMDSDDICLNHRFEKQIKYLEANPDVSLFSGYISEFKDTPGDIYSVREVPAAHHKIVKSLKWRNAFNHMAVMYKKSVIIAAGGYDTGAAFFEDYDLWIRLVMARHKTGNIPEVLVYARIGNNMITRRGGISYLRKEIDFLGKQKNAGFISTGEYILLLFIRIPIRLIPVKVLNIIYRKCLRERYITPPPPPI